MSSEAHYFQVTKYNTKENKLYTTTGPDGPFESMSNRIQAYLTLRKKLMKKGEEIWSVTFIEIEGSDIGFTQSFIDDGTFEKFVNYDENEEEEDIWDDEDEEEDNIWDDEDC